MRNATAAIIAVAMGVIAAAGPVAAGTLSTFTGAGDLDLSGSFDYAVDIPGAGGTVDGLAFTGDSVAGVTVGAGNIADPWATKPDYTGPDDTVLEDIMHSIRWSSGSNVTVDLAVTPGTQYKLQLLWSENHYTTSNQRTFDVVVNGTTALTGFDILAATGNRVGAPTVGAVYTDTLTPYTGTLNVTLSPGGTAGDKNPIINALTLERLATPAYVSTVLADNPRGYWRLGESTGTTAIDTADAAGLPQGGAQNGTYSGGYTLGASGAGAGDTAAMFDGANGQVTIADTTHPTAYTIEAWVNPASIRAQNIFVRTAADPTTTWSHQIRMTADGKFEAYTYTGGARSVIGTTVALPGQWYHVVATATGGGDMKLYVDGAEEGTSVTLGALWTGGNQYRIGSSAGKDAQAMAFFDGTIDEAALYLTALDAGRIADHYNAIPEPGSMTLLALGGLALIRRNRC